MEQVKTNDSVYFTANFYHPSSGYSVTADTTPRWFVYEDGYTEDLIDGDMVERANLGLYYGSFVASGWLGFDSNAFYDVQVSGSVDGLSGFASVKQFVLDDIFDTNVIQVSGEAVDINSFKSGLSVLTQTDIRAAVGLSSANLDTQLISLSGDLSTVNTDIYFASVKYIRDNITDADEYSAIWFKNDQPVAVDDLTNPALSVYDTVTGVPIIDNEVMNMASANIASVRYNESVNLIASGEPYLIAVSGTIDSVTRRWQNIIGIDYI